MSQAKDFLESLLLSCPGFVGEIARSVDSHLKHSRPSISLPAALAFVAAIKSGRVVADNGIECTLYVLSLAPTGYGKTRAQNVLEDITAKAGIKNLFGNEPTSDSGLISGLALQNRQLLLWDEFGEALDDLSNSKNSPKATVLTAMTKAFSSAGRTLRGKQYADGHKSEAENVFLSVFGVSNQFSFENAINERFVHNGFLGRWLCFVPDKNKPELKPCVPKPVSDECIEWLRRVDIWRPAVGNLASAMKKDKKVVPLSTFEAFRSGFENFDELAENCKSEVERAFWARAGELYTKLCLIFTDKTPKDEELTWCWMLVEELILAQIKRCKDLMGGNDDKSRAKDKYIKLIATGEEISQSELYRRSYRLPLSKIEKSDMNEMMIESGKWEVTTRKQSPNDRKVRKYYKCLLNS